MFNYTHCICNAIRKTKRDILLSIHIIATVDVQGPVKTAADLMLSNKILHSLMVDEKFQKSVGIIAPTKTNS